jgi:3-oxoacyl-[acyl-carrier-protein] synthase II
MKKRVVVTGIGLLTPLGRGVLCNTEALKNGKTGISHIKSFDTSRHKSSLGAEVDNSLIDKDFSEYADRASMLLLASCRDAIKSAALEINEKKGLEAQIILGTTLGGMLSGQEYHRNLLRGKENKAIVLRDSLACHQAPYIANKLNLIGEALVVNNACASGLNAIGCAFNRIRSGNATIAIAGGYDTMSDFTHAGFSSLELVTSGKCQPFDKNRSGLVLGEGAGILILEEMDQALRRKANILAEIIGYGQSSDAYHITKPDPEALGASRAITMAINDAKILPGGIDYVNAHGTGTIANDSMESKALHLALGEHGVNVPVSSTKPMTGHLLGAAGSVEVIFSIIAINNSMIPENLNYETPDSECKLNIVTGGIKNCKLNTVLSNSFGFGGSNSAMLIKRFS